MDKKREKELLFNINRDIDTLISECHESTCVARQNPMVCCPSKCNTENVMLYTVALGGKVIIRLLPSASGFPYYWPQIVWQLRLLALQIAGGRNLDSARNNIMRSLFYDLIELTKLSTKSKDIQSELATVSRTFTKILDV